MNWFDRKKTIEGCRVQAVCVSETGLVRKDNQDSVLSLTDEKVFCIADGMGGGSEGARASAIVCREVKHAIANANANFEDRKSAIEFALASANSKIFDYSQKHGFAQMGSTVAVLVMDPTNDNRSWICHVGDSRIYRIRGGLAASLTRDHSVGFELGDFAGKHAGALRSRENPLAHVLTRAVGTAAIVQWDAREIDANSGDRYVICTDGVHDVISDMRLAVFAGGSMASAAQRLSEAVIRQGAPDNYSFIIVQA